jgi:hypothetical protein
MKAVTVENHVYIKNGDGKEELFNIKRDPQQSRDLSGLPQSGPILDQFRTILERLQPSRGAVIVQ